MPSDDPFYGTYAWKQQRGRVFDRDGYRCRKCKAIGKQAGGFVRLICDHKRVSLRTWRSWGRAPEDYPDAWCETLCDTCSGRKDGGVRYGTRSSHNAGQGPSTHRR